MNEDPTLPDAAMHPDHPSAPMPTPTQHRAPMLIAAFAVGLLAAAGIVAAAMAWIPAPNRGPVPVAPLVAAAPSTVYVTVPATSPPPAPVGTARMTVNPVVAAAAPDAATPAVRGTDGQGFVGSPAAHCRSGHPAAAVLRTAVSQAVICQGDDGGYYYRAVRLADGAALEVGGASPTGDGFVARTGSYSYLVSPVGLTVSRYGNTLSTQQALEFWAR
ncbi:hypothetical protein [Rhodococcus kronopolitis]|uniref:Serine/threonine protein kinase n=1 Tax=Rhodococcus kronopolitis TaxID=1460226 RepID=A0ABV9FQ18_9NOCA